MHHRSQTPRARNRRRRRNRSVSLVAAVALSVVLGTSAAAGIALSVANTPADAESFTPRESRPAPKTPEQILVEGMQHERAVVAAADQAARLAAEQAQLAAAAAAQAEADRIWKYGRTGVNWDGIARCETNGNWRMRGSRYSGGLGFYNGTWNAFGGRQFAPNAGLASREQQIVVAERVYAAYGLSGWGCRRFG